MLTLHTLTEKVKTGAKWTGIGIGIIFLLVLFLKGVFLLKNTFFPTPPSPPTVTFGQLPLIIFPNSIATGAYTYSIETISGNLPILPDRAAIFKIIQKEPSLLDLQRARDSIMSLGFSLTGLYPAVETPLSLTEYQWRNKTSLNKSLTMDIVSNNFKIESDFMTNGAVLTARSVPTEEEAKQKSLNVPQVMNLSIQDLDPMKTLVKLMQIKDAALIPASSYSSTQIIRVDLFQKNLNNIPIVYPNPPYSTMNFLLGGNEYGGDIVQANFTHQNISDLSGTYPLKSSAQAFKELGEGKAYIASYYGSSNNIKIKNVYLAYFAGEEKQDFLMPVVVFEGNNGFFAYVSAITDNWIKL